MKGWAPIETAPKDGSIIWAGSKPLWVIFGDKRKWCPQRSRWIADFGSDGWIPTIADPTHWWTPYQPENEA